MPKKKLETTSKKSLKKKPRESIRKNPSKTKNDVYRGRPIDYTPELGALICERVATHDFSTAKICAQYDDMPDEKTIQRWRYRIEEFRLQYAVAKIKQAELLAESCLEISDDSRGDIKVNENGYEVFDGEFAARSRLRVDTRKWLASKLLPKAYGGDSLLQQAKEENDDLKDEVRKLRAKLDEKNKRDY